MRKFAKIINEKTKKCLVGIGDNIDFYKSLGMEEMDVERAYDSFWYVVGYAPQEPEKTYAEKRKEEYPPVCEQLDMIYHDKVDNTNLWQEKITQIKTKYPKE